MSKIRKRGNSYQIDYFDPTGKRVRQSFTKRKEAEAELGKRVSMIDENPKRYLEKTKILTTIFDELVTKYKENFKNQRSFNKSKQFSIKRIEKEFSGRRLINISYLDLETYRNRLKDTLTQHGTIRQDSSVNRVMACLRHMLTKAVEWDMLDRNPFDKGHSLQLKENNKQLEFLSEDEIVSLLANCPDQSLPKIKRNDYGVFQGKQAIYLKDFIIIGINSGMRKMEILSLKYSQIRNGFIYLDKTKSGEARQIPINNDLEACLKDIRKRNQFTSEYLFSNENGGHIGDIKTAFKSAVKRAGIEKKVHPHTLRHTFASHFLMRGGSLKALKEILGHAEIKMTMRYAHLSKEFAREEIQLMNGLTSQKQEVTEKPIALNPTCHKTVTSLDSVTASCQ